MAHTEEITPDRIDEAARILVEKNGVNVVVVSLGADGAIVVDGDHALRVPAPAVDVVSRIGAGDSMVAGLVLALARGDAIDDAVRYGVAAGSAAVTTPGHRLGTHEMMEKLFAEISRAASGALVTA
jgi:6-phosphofructokinase 2